MKRSPNVSNFKDFSQGKNFYRKTDKIFGDVEKNSLNQV